MNLYFLDIYLSAGQLRIQHRVSLFALHATAPRLHLRARGDNSLLRLGRE